MVKTHKRKVTKRRVSKRKIMKKRVTRRKYGYVKRGGAGAFNASQIAEIIKASGANTEAKKRYLEEKLKNFVYIPDYVSPFSDEIITDKFYQAVVRAQAYTKYQDSI
jgi:hypothetical protein